MTRHLFVTIAALALAAPALRADEPKPDAPKVEAKAPDMKGTWVPAEGTMAGKKLPENFLNQTKLTLTDDKYTVVVGEEKEEGTFKVDSGKKPVTIDITPTAGRNKGKTIPAIVELSGDTMKVCYNTTGADRPKDFSSTEENKFIIMVYKRQK